MKRTSTKKEDTATKKGRVKVGKLKSNKETVKDLSPGAKKRIQGGGQLGMTFNLCVKA